MISKLDIEAGDLAGMFGDMIDWYSDRGWKPAVSHPGNTVLLGVSGFTRASEAPLYNAPSISFICCELSRPALRDIAVTENGVVLVRSSDILRYPPMKRRLWVINDTCTREFLRPLIKWMQLFGNVKLS